MEFFQNYDTLAIGIAAFIAGVVLMYLVMRRTNERLNENK